MGYEKRSRRFRPMKFVPLDVSELIAMQRGADVTAGDRATGSHPKHHWRDIMLFAFEAIALVGFVAILLSLYLELQSLNLQTRAMLRSAPSAEEALPVAPIPTDAPASPFFPEEAHVAWASQLPPHLAGLVKSSVPMAKPPTPGPQSARRLVIPSIGVDAPVVEGDGPEELKKGIGHLVGSANPGEKGNMVVSAHNDAFGEIFRDLHKLEPGAEVLVYTHGGAFRYVVNRVEIVLPTKVDVMNPTDHPVLTMITCYPYLLDTHRVVAVADLAN